MQNIQPKQIYFNGLEVEATKFNLQTNFDNLLNKAIFYWQLFDVNNTPLMSGELTMINPDYDLWNGDANINYSAYQWAAAILNITLV